MENNLFKILLVDDNPKNIQVLGNILHNQGYNTEYALSGMEALEWMKDENFDLILLDIMMPIMDGYEVCETIRKNHAFDNVPIIFLTAKTDKESTIKGLKLKAQDYINKPFNSEELLARIKTQLELKYSKDKLENVNKYLEEQVKIRTEELNEANVSLEKANIELLQLDSAKSNFLNLLSHEIRTPLNGIIGPLQLLKNRIDNENLINLINILELSVTRLEKFSYTTLLITTLKSGKREPELEQININQLIEFSIIEFGDQINAKSLKINSDSISNGLILTGEYELIMEAFKRALDNAITFSENNSEIQIQVNQLTDKIELIIKDQGSGFPETILNKKLELFNSADVHHNENVGLDLYLIEQIIQAHQGILTFGNNPDKGAFINFSFPAK